VTKAKLSHGSKCSESSELRGGKDLRSGRNLRRVRHASHAQQPTINSEAGSAAAARQRHHKELWKSVKAEEERKSGPKPAKVQCTVLNGVKMSPDALQLNCLRLVSENGLAFKVLDYPAMQGIIKPMVDAMPASQR